MKLGLNSIEHFFNGGKGKANGSFLKSKGLVADSTLLSAWRQGHEAPVTSPSEGSSLGKRKALEETPSPDS